MKKATWINFGLVAVAVLLVGALAFAVVGDQVFADEGDDPEELPDFGGFGPGPNHPGRKRYGNFLRYGREAMLDSIAEQTGISVEELEAALEDRTPIEELLMDAGYSEEEIGEIFLTAQYAAIDQAVEEGKLTEEEAEETKAKLAELAEQREVWEANREAYHQIWIEKITEKSDFTVAEIEAAMEDGINVHKLLEGTYPEEEAHAIIEEAWSETVDQALAEGLITEEQAEKLAENPPFSKGPRERITAGLEERFGEGWQEEFKRRMNPDCDCTCPGDGDA